VVSGRQPDWPPGVAFSCEYQPAFAHVLGSHLREIGFHHWPTAFHTVHCHRADRVTGGKGEIWWLNSTPV
ncbi:MAG: hypothetical protein U0798_20460, partial [Gemmataceae bacterium]